MSSVILAKYGMAAYVNITVPTYIVGLVTRQPQSDDLKGFDSCHVCLCGFFGQLVTHFSFSHASPQN